MTNLIWDLKGKYVGTFMIDAPPLVCKVEGSSQYSRRVGSKLTWW